MPKKLLTEKEKKQSREKPLRREFGNSPSYTNRNDLKYYKDNKERNLYGERSYMVLSGPAIAKQSPSIYGLIEQLYPRIGFYTYIPKDNNNLENDEFRDYIGKSMLYRWDLGSGFLNARHEPQIAVPGEKNYPRIVLEFVDLSNMSGHPAYVGQSPELSKQLPELVITPKRKYFIVRLSKGGSMHKLIPKHLLGNRIYLPKKNLIDFIAPLYIEYEQINDDNSLGILFTKGLKSFRREEPKMYGYMGHNVKRYIDYTPISYPSVSETNYLGEGENLEKEYTTEHIKLNNGQLPWWYEGSEPKRALELPEVVITTKGTPFTRTYDWYNSGYKYPYTIIENVGIDRNGNDSIISSFMVNPLGDSLYTTGQFPEILSPRGESIFNNRLMQKNNTEKARQKFIEDYRRTKKTITY